MRGSYNGYYIALPRQKWQFDSATPLKTTLQVGEACSNLQSPRKEIVYEVKTPTVKFVEVRITTLSVETYAVKGLADECRGCK